MNVQTPPTIESVVSELRARMRGRVVTPADPDYDRLRTVTDGSVDARPAVIARVADADDVAAVIAVARASQLPFAVRCGGHGGRLSTNDDGIVLDVRELRDIEIDEQRRTISAGAGLTAVEVSIAAAAKGLALGFGDTGSVGIGGITLGGGIGYLARKWGLTIDSLLGVDLVTADGRRLRADADTNPDLFWALRGGGGNFGVATRFEYRLQPLPEAVGGMLILPATAETIDGFIAAADAAPGELTTIANVMPAPPMPFLPEETVGQLVIVGILLYAGTGDAADAALAPFRSLATPLADMIKAMPYAEIYPPDDEEYRPKAAARTMFIERVDRPTAETILHFLESSDASLRVAQLRVLGGAVSRVPSEATAYAHRASRILVNVAAFWEGPDRQERERWVDDFVAALDQGDAGKYVNFVGNEGDAGVRAAYPGNTWDRLAEIKARYDPTNLFRGNQNIRPAAG